MPSMGEIGIQAQKRKLDLGLSTRHGCAGRTVLSFRLKDKEVRLGLSSDVVRRFLERFGCDDPSNPCGLKGKINAVCGEMGVLVSG